VSKPRLIYFPSRGRGELSRIVLAEAGVDYDEENFNGPDEFAALKKSGRLPFEAVPVWEEPDGFRLAQSVAIAQHVARVHGLYGKSEKEHALVDQMIGVYDDVRAEMRKLITTEAAKRPALRVELTEKILPMWFARLEKVLASNHGGDAFVIGDGVTLADLILYYLLELADGNGFGSAFANQPKLVAHMKRIAARPRIAAYVKSPKRHAFQPFPT
jgi:glutathione S-transferase